MTIQPFRAHWRIALAIFALTAGIYLLTTGAHTSSKDEELYFGVAENLVNWRSFALNAGQSDGPSMYSYYGPGQPIAAIPLYLLGRGLALLFPSDATPWITRAITLWLNPLVTATTAGLIALATLLLGYQRHVAIATALIYAFGTLALPYSKTFFAEPLTAMLPFAACVLILYDTAAPQPRTWLTQTPTLLILSGLLAGLTLTVKVHGALIVPFVGLYAGVSSPVRSPHIARCALRVVFWSIGATLAVALLFWYQWSIYHNPFSTGYGSGVLKDFNHRYFWYRLNGLIWSSGRGIIWYSPPVMVSLPSLFLLWKNHRLITSLCGVVTLAHFCFYALLLYWHGGGSWGPRYLTIAMPFMILPLAAFLQTVHGWRTPWRTTALVGIVLLTLPVQLGSVAIANEAFFSTKRNISRDHFDPLDSAIVGHLTLVGQRILHAYEVYIAPNSVAFTSGFSYSEGNREKAEHLPRWTNSPQATIMLRPPTAQTTHIKLALKSCLPVPLSPLSVTLRLNGNILVSHTPCPSQVYHFIAPAKRSQFTIESALWNPADVGIRREGKLGVLVQDLVIWADQHRMQIYSYPIPITTMPTGYVSIRRWTGDHRLDHWDFWWWYISFSDLPRIPLTLLVGLWLTIAIGCIAWGIRELRNIW